MWLVWLPGAFLWPELITWMLPISQTQYSIIIGLTDWLLGCWLVLRAWCLPDFCGVSLANGKRFVARIFVYERRGWIDASLFNCREDADQVSMNTATDRAGRPGGF